MKHILILLCLLGITSSLYAQSKPIIPFEAEIVSMGYDEQNSLLEIYLGFEASKLPFEQTNEGIYQALVPFAGVLTKSYLNQNPEVIWSDAARLAFTAQDSLGMKNQTFVHVIRVLVPAGEYQLELRTIAQGDKFGELKSQAVVKVDDYNQGGAKLGEVLLATNISRSTDTLNPLYRNGAVVDVNPSLLFGNKLSKLFYYAEAYQTQNINLNGKYTAYTYIAEANIPRPIDGYESRIEKTSRGTDIINGYFDVSKLPTQSYFLKMVLLDESNAVVSEQTKKFFVYNPDVQRPEVNSNGEEAYLASGFATMPDTEVKEAIDQIAPLLTNSELARLRQLTELENRRRFLFEAWQARDTNKETLVNEFRLDYLNRIQFANDRYATPFKPGWRTEQGRVILKYGQPQDLQVYNFDKDKKPYEIWTYNNLPGVGQATFVFADIDEVGIKELIHSTVPGENYDPSWQTRVVKM